MINIQVNEKHFRVLIIAPQGRIDAFSVATLREAQNKLLEDGGIFFVVDLRQVTFMDSAAMAALVSLLKRSRQGGGTVALVEPLEEAALRTIMLTKFDKVFPMAKTVEEALKLLW